MGGDGGEKGGGFGGGWGGGTVLGARGRGAWCAGRCPGSRAIMSDIMCCVLQPAYTVITVLSQQPLFVLVCYCSSSFLARPNNPAADVCGSCHVGVVLWGVVLFVGFAAGPPEACVCTLFILCGDYAPPKEHPQSNHPPPPTVQSQ
jgi:hypothetical protein